jgi:hypothetical protein
MNTHFSTPDPRHLWGESATHPRRLFLNALDSVTNPRDTHGIPAVCALPGHSKTALSGASNCRFKV